MVHEITRKAYINTCRHIASRSYSYTFTLLCGCVDVEELGSTSGTLLPHFLSVMVYSYFKLRLRQAFPKYVYTVRITEV